MTFLRIFIVCFLFAAGASAQTLRGRVSDAGTGAPLYPVAIINVRTQQSVYTDEDGRFSLTARAGDQIAFTFIGYSTLRWTSPTTLGAPEHSIQMERLSVQLKEFVFAPGKTQYQLDSAQRRSTYTRSLARVPGGSLMSPVTLLAERISPRSRQIARFQKEFYRMEQERFIDSRYSAELVAALTGLEGDSLAYFMNAHPMPFDYARTASELELKSWIRSNFKAWLRRIQDSTVAPEAGIGAR